jgi:hypothetical protein
MNTGIRGLNTDPRLSSSGSPHTALQPQSSQKTLLITALFLFPPSLPPRTAPTVCRRLNPLHSLLPAAGGGALALYSSASWQPVTQSGSGKGAASRAASTRSVLAPQEPAKLQPLCQPLQCPRLPPTPPPPTPRRATALARRRRGVDDEGCRLQYADGIRRHVAASAAGGPRGFL